MTDFYPEFLINLGTQGVQSVWIKDQNGDWQEFINYSYFKVTKRINQLSEFEVKFHDVEDAEKVYLKEHAEIIFYVDTTIILKGRIQKVTYGTAYDCNINGYGMEALILDQELIKNNDKRVQYSVTSAQTVAKEILSENTDGLTPWIMQPSSEGLFSSDYGNVDLRFEYANRLNCLGKLAEAIDYEWWVAQGDDLETDYFYISEYMPTTSRATSVQDTFTISGVDANCNTTSNEKDMNNVANKIDVLGYGDGINQLSISTYNASSIYSTLSADCTAVATTISLADASAFPSSGEVRIAEERVTYSGKSGNNLTGCTRGANSTVARTHKKFVYVEKYTAISSPDPTSSIGIYGLLDYSVTNRDLINLDTAELVASKILLDRMNPIVRIIFDPNEPNETIANRFLGDLITVTDPESSLSGNYRIVGMTFTSDYGNISLEVECSNRSLTFIEQMQKQKDEQTNIQKYMQGATNLYDVNVAENCDATHPLDLRFYLPADVVAINKVLLNFKLKDFRSYETATASNSALTVIASSATTSSSVAVNSNAWTNMIGITSANTDCDGIYLNFSVDVADITTTAPGGGGQFSYRIYDGTSYYPSSSEGQMICGGIISHKFDAAYDIPLSGTIGCFIPGNQKNKTFTLQMKWDGYANDSDWIFNTSADYRTISSHTHNMAFGIYEETLATPSVDVKVGEDGGSLTAIGTYTSDQAALDITTAVEAVGTNKWIDVQFTPNKRMRIEGDCYIKVFIESK